MKLFNRIKIRTKLLLLIAVMVALTIAVSATCIISVLTISDSFENITLTITLPQEKSDVILTNALFVRERAISTILIALISGLLIVTPVSIIVVTVIVRPLQSVSETAAELTNGNIPARLSDDSYATEYNAPDLKSSVRDEIAVLDMNFYRMCMTIKNLQRDLRILAKNAIDGSIDTRVDLDKYTGVWNLLVTDLNTLLDNIILPVKEANTVLCEISNGNLDKRVQGDYSGDFALLKESVNTTAAGIQSFISGVLEAERIALESEIAKSRAEAARKVVLDSIKYASKIQRNLLPRNSLFEQAFSDYSIIWNPRDIVGGDIYWIKNFAAGTVLCVCDCTGHGTPGALLTMLVVSAFQDLVNDSNCFDTAEIIWRLDQRLVSVLSSESNGDNLDIKDGCDLAVLFISTGGDISISSGHIHVFVSDGVETTQIRGQNLYVGSGKLKNKEKIKIMSVPHNPDNKFYIATDGLYDQVGLITELPFGYKRFKKLILDNHDKCQNEITEIIWNAFENYRAGSERLDDFALVAFQI